MTLANESMEAAFRWQEEPLSRLERDRRAEREHLLFAARLEAEGRDLVFKTAGAVEKGKLSTREREGEAAGPRATGRLQVMVKDREEEEQAPDGDTGSI